MFLKRLIYSSFLLVLSPLLILLLWRQKKRAGVGADSEKWQRLGLQLNPVLANGWLIHCASVGEVVAVSGLVNHILQQQPALPLTITTASATGAARVRQLFGERVVHQYLPFDFAVCIRRLLLYVGPSKVIIVEAELWPNMLFSCQELSIPVYVVNGRMTHKTLEKMQRFSWLYQPLCQIFTSVSAQSEQDAINYQKWGVAAEKVSWRGNLKLDIQLTSELEQKQQQLASEFNLHGRTILLAGSTHNPEEQLILDCFQKLKQHIPDLLLILVPRHPQRFKAVEELCQSRFEHVRCYSQGQATQPNTDIFIADGMGLLSALYGCADVVFVGGSLAPKGGHNPLEAAIWAKPVVMGSSQYNNADICHLLTEHQALSTVKSPENLYESCLTLLLNPEESKKRGERAALVVQQNQGAVQNNYEMLTAPHSWD
ncbi:3-deoxy-D-manno-octulosonic acid transferase [Neptunicella marina]|uniref:3-deoxy-D-manno-octulosonic acid transferase n=1 Tax=Neptunicella marina TaxID=2125989 RepID=A0A8J6IU04_9ALTE|nr:3-deoxy-D-manno-octulosonic acid transferase [Neptunicella marina]MBC3765902.1 3-deoxy-D-manno-octulosonic acid transferase [Neptunicella marina]